ncbi:multiple epidermal growth factor-like domains 10 [Elysia marginata]|uniref:Multiple epidermal growth factor-like domains 10 n=1 Tax=Elysia marginata TaxID=1093978 RepID=A0AAV4GLE5_9GAST|nr:multiple epidermal growth factor-like domains 10 [Elysia marginata]
MSISKGLFQPIRADCETNTTRSVFVNGTSSLRCGSGCVLGIESASYKTNDITLDVKEWCQSKNNCSLKMSGQNTEKVDGSVLYYCRLACNKPAGKNCGGGCNETCRETAPPQTRCDPSSGTCTSGCDAGYQGDFCEETCNKTVGKNCGGGCNETCRETAAPQTRCDPSSGTCTSGCDAGYQGDFCEEKCNNGTYGENCGNTCSENCLGICHHVTGVCLQGCRSGYSGELCDTPCYNTYGANCAKSCSVTCKNTGPQARCNRFSGACASGCKAGYRGDFCENICINRTYGENCTGRCSIFCNGTGKTCSPINGACFYGCRLGFTGETCTSLPIIEPPVRHYGSLFAAALGVLGVVVIAIVLLVKIEEQQNPEENDKPFSFDIFDHPISKRMDAFAQQVYKADSIDDSGTPTDQLSTANPWGHVFDFGSPVDVARASQLSTYPPFRQFAKPHRTRPSMGFSHASSTSV